jgi:Na+/proline symporter
MEVPRLINFGIGGGWTAMMILTYMFALMGIQSSPAFTLWNFGIASPKPLAWQQVFMSTFVVGVALFFFSAFQGIGAELLKMAGELPPDLGSGDVVPMLMTKFLPGPVLGLVFMGAIAAIHSTAAPYIGTGGTIIQRDVWWRYVRNQGGTHSEQIWTNRIFSTLLCGASVVVSLTASDAIVMVGGFATAFGTIMYLLLLGVHWGFKFPSIGAALGMICSIVACFLTFYIWKYPLSMHTAFWGIFTGLAVAYLCRGLGLKDSEETIARQKEVRTWLNSIDGPTENGKKWRARMKILVPVWYFFAIGPACMLGNNAFSFAGFTPLWSWQIAWWIVGIVLMWALCFKAEMSTTSEEQIRRADIETMDVTKEAD